MNLWELQKNRPSLLAGAWSRPRSKKRTQSRTLPERKLKTERRSPVAWINPTHLTSTQRRCRSAHPSVTSLTTSLTQFRTRFLLLINEFYLYSTTTTYLKIVIRCPMRWSLCSGLVWSELVYSTILPWMIERGEPSSSIVRPYKTHRMNSPVVSSHVSSWWYLFSWSARDWSNYVQ